MQTVRIADRVESEVIRNTWALQTELPDPDLESFVEVSQMDDAELAKAAKILGASPELIREIDSYLASLRQSMHEDLAQIWEKVA